MKYIDRSRRTQGGVKMGVLAWLLGAPLLVIVIAFLACR